MNKLYWPIALFLLTSCNNYAPAMLLDADSLNARIIDGIQQNAEWVKSPSDIARELFPCKAKSGENFSYNIETRDINDNAWTVTVTTEIRNPRAERERIPFVCNRKDGKWMVREVKKAVNKTLF